MPIVQDPSLVARETSHLQPPAAPGTNPTGGPVTDADRIAQLETRVSFLEHEVAEMKKIVDLFMGHTHEYAVENPGGLQNLRTLKEWMNGQLPDGPQPMQTGWTSDGKPIYGPAGPGFPDLLVHLISPYDFKAPKGLARTGPPESPGIAPPPK